MANNLYETYKRGTHVPGGTTTDAAKRRAEAKRVAAQRLAAQRAQAAAQAQAAKRAQTAANQAAKRRAEAAQKSYAARTAALSKQRMQRRQKHVVTKKDTPESIAKKYGIEPSAVGQAAGVRLRAGSSIELDVPVSGRMDDPSLAGAYEAKGEFDKETASRADRLREWFNESQLDLNLREEEIRRGGVGAINPELEVAAGVSPGFYERLEGDPAFPDSAAQRITGGSGWQGMPEYKSHFDFEHQVRVGSVRGKYQMANNAWLTGDDSMRPDFFTDWELSQFSEHVQGRILDELGYRRDKEGKWVPIEILDEDYGMGGYSFPGYGVGGGGGGVGEYEAPPGKGSSYGGRKSGGRTRLSTSKMFAGSVPRTHWRMG